MELPGAPLVHVRIIADAVLRMLTAPVKTVRSQAFNIVAHSQNYRVRDLAEIVRETFPRCVVEHAGNGRVGVARRTMPICTPAHGGRDFEPWLRPSGEAA